MFYLPYLIKKKKINNPIIEAANLLVNLDTVYMTTQ